MRAITARHDHLIRTPLKALAAQLPTQQFWQIHRGTLVCASAIASVARDGDGDDDGAGRLQLQLHNRPEKLAVSRLCAHLFKAMSFPPLCCVHGTVFTVLSCARQHSHEPMLAWGSQLDSAHFGTPVRRHF